VKVLLDECLPRRLQRELPGFEVHTVTGINWDGESDDALLPRAAAAGFDFLLTADQNLPFQQNLTLLPTLRVIVFRTFRNTVPELLPLVKQFVEQHSVLPAGTATIFSGRE
jgi:predicted nuclease of predicted toxin-antitoxin system